jgi:hypothetical protein
VTNAAANQRDAAPHCAFGSIPAILNKTDYTIGFKMDMESVLRALDLIGFRKHGSHGNGYVLSDGHTDIRLFEPREDWHPVLQVI